MPKKIYVIIGSVGEYSDRSEHVAGWTGDEELAKEFVEMLSVESRELMKTWDAWQFSSFWDYAEELKFKQALLKDAKDKQWASLYVSEENWASLQLATYRYGLAEELVK